MNTANLALPLLASNQAQKHVTHNEALLVLDDLSQISVIRADLTSPPSMPPNDARYIVHTPASGVWTGHDREIAVWRDGGWSFHAPKSGWLAHVQLSGEFQLFNGTAWTGAIKMAQLGINTLPDATNRLSLSSPASLFSGDGAGHQLKINKTNSSNSASVLFQTGFSGRAELGLNGDNAFSLRTSIDGLNWLEALRVDAAGAVSLTNTPTPVSTLNIGDNLLINGHFSINQRVFAGGALAANTYGFDRWRAGAAGANLTVASGIVTLASGEIAQIIEPQAWGYASMAGQSVVISLENPTADIRVGIAGVFGTITAGSGRRSVTLAIPVSFVTPPVLSLARLTAGSVNFARVKLELGLSATLWQARPISLEEKLAQRYFTRLTGPIWLYLYAQASGNYFYQNLSLPVSMRIAPAITRTVGSSGNILAGNLANIVASGLSLTIVRVYIRANAAGECFANIDRIDCDAEMT